MTLKSEDTTEAEMSLTDYEKFAITAAKQHN